MNIFVYGNLLAGMSRHMSLAGTPRLGPASVQGTLWDVGAYPGLKEGTGVVTGELHEVGGDVLRRVDKVEGFDAGDPHGSLYVRREVSARRFSDGTPVQAVTYFYNKTTGDAALIATSTIFERDRASSVWISAILMRLRLGHRILQAWDEQAAVF